MSGHHAYGEEKVLGVTHDPVLRPIGKLIAIVGTIWLLFSGMALEAGTYGQPLGAVDLIVIGILVARMGGESVQI